MNIEEAMEGRTVTMQQVIIELKKHDADYIEFVNDLGEKPEYNSKDVLEWLGY